jgi:hypothetical protein
MSSAAIRLSAKGFALYYPMLPLASAREWSMWRDDRGRYIKRNRPHPVSEYAFIHLACSSIQLDFMCAVFAVTNLRLSLTSASYGSTTMPVDSNPEALTAGLRRTTAEKLQYCRRDVKAEDEVRTASMTRCRRTELSSDDVSLSQSMHVVHFEILYSNLSVFICVCSRLLASATASFAPFMRIYCHHTLHTSRATPYPLHRALSSSTAPKLAPLAACPSLTPAAWHSTPAHSRSYYSRDSHRSPVLRKRMALSLARATATCSYPAPAPAPALAPEFLPQYAHRQRKEAICQSTCWAR